MLNRRSGKRFGAAVRAVKPGSDEMRFFKSWLGNPLMIGAVAPSGPQLALQMAKRLDLSRQGAVIELGPGTGVVTAAILEQGVSAERLISIEYDENFCGLLRKRFQDVRIIHGDAYDLRNELAGHVDGSVAGIVSSLPLFTRPLKDRRRLIEDCLELLAPGAPFIQFSYALVPPVPPDEGRFLVRRSNWVLRNLPPARVWTYRRSHVA